ncbi:hypothetical protein LBMAG53_28610 [Planctomycetota bacterium]|nr:hypothetical protein LBMAG53_28610 [Planctomycetota bacterium]
MSVILSIGIVTGIISIITIDQWPTQTVIEHKSDYEGNIIDHKRNEIYKPNIPLMYMIMSLCFTALSIAGIIGIKMVVKNDGKDKDVLG